MVVVVLVAVAWIWVLKVERRRKEEERGVCVCASVYVKFEECVVGKYIVYIFVVVVVVGDESKFMVSANWVCGCGVCCGSGP